MTSWIDCPETGGFPGFRFAVAVSAWAEVAVCYTNAFDQVILGVGASNNDGEWLGEQGHRGGDVAGRRPGAESPTRQSGW